MVAYVNKQLSIKVPREEDMIPTKKKNDKVDSRIMAITYTRNLPNISGILRKDNPFWKKLFSINLYGGIQEAQKYRSIGPWKTH